MLIDPGHKEMCRALERQTRTNSKGRTENPGADYVAEVVCAAISHFGLRPLRCKSHQFWSLSELATDLLEVSRRVDGSANDVNVEFGWLTGQKARSRVTREGFLAVRNS